MTQSSQNKDNATGRTFMTTWIYIQGCILLKL